MRDGPARRDGGTAVSRHPDQVGEAGAALSQSLSKVRLPAALTTKAFADGTMLLALGADGSSK
jgi:hypothetical protein